MKKISAYKRAVILAVAFITLCGVTGGCSDTGESGVKFDIGGEYAYASDFSEGLAAVKDQSGFKYIDASGAVKFTAEAVSAGDFSGGRAWFVKADGSGGYLDKEGNVIFTQQGATVNTMRNYREGLAVINVVQGYGVNCFVIDEEGRKSALFPEYANTGGYGDFCEGIASFSGDNNLYGYKDTAGNMVAEPVYAAAGDFSCGAAAVKEGNACFVIDKSGVKLFEIPAEYSEYTAFKDDVLKVKVNGGYNFIGKDGEKLFAENFGYATDFCNGYAAVRGNGEFYVTDKGGNKVCDAPSGATEVLYGEEGIFAFRTASGWGAFNLKGEIVLQAEYDYLGKSSGDLMACRKEGKWGYMRVNED